MKELIIALVIVFFVAWSYSIDWEQEGPTDPSNCMEQQVAC